MRGRFESGGRNRVGLGAMGALAGLVVGSGLVLGGCGAEPETGGSFPEGSNILLITIDTLRADHLSAYGYPRATSPTLERLATEGVLFERPVVQWPKTGPSFASIFTSTYPKDNRIVRRIGIPIPESFQMLAEALKAAGYGTHAVVANGALAKDFQFHQGFDTYVETWHTPLSDGDERDPNGAERVTDLALEIAAGLEPGRPYFLWVHYLDPHFPYTPPEPWGELFMTDEHYDPGPKIAVDYAKRRQQMAGIGSEQVLDGHEDLAFYEARYDAEIAYTDSEIARLLDRLRERNLLENTLTAVTSDHGESLGEHYYFFDHGRFGFQTCLRVPLIVHFPGVLEPRVDPDPVELIHLAPTLLEVAGVELEGGAWMRGRSLAQRLSGGAREASEEAPAAPAFSEAGYAQGGQWQKVVQNRHFKLIYAPAFKEQRWIGGGGQPFALYDLESDPEETRNLVDEHPEETKRLKIALTKWLRAEPVFVDAEGERQVNENMSQETRRLLEALGYL